MAKIKIGGQEFEEADALQALTAMANFNSMLSTPEGTRNLMKLVEESGAYTPEPTPKQSQGFEPSGYLKQFNLSDEDLSDEGRAVLLAMAEQNRLLTERLDKVEGKLEPVAQHVQLSRAQAQAVNDVRQHVGVNATIQDIQKAQMTTGLKDPVAAMLKVQSLQATPEPAPHGPGGASPRVFQVNPDTDPAAVLEAAMRGDTVEYTYDPRVDVSLEEGGKSEDAGSE